MYRKNHRPAGQVLLKSGLKLAAALAFVAALSGCGAQSTSYDSSLAYPVDVVKKTTAISVKVSPVDGSMSYTHQARLRAFVVDYVRRAQSPMLVMTAPGAGKTAADARSAVVRDMLVEAGMRPGDVLLRPGASPIGGKDSVVLSFRGYTAKVPTCGNWSTESSFMPNNATHGNFGCAYQRNIGLMVSNPRDLMRSEIPGTLDPSRRNLVILNSRAGEGTGSAISGEEESGVGAD